MQSEFAGRRMHTTFPRRNTIFSTSMRVSRGDDGGEEKRRGLSKRGWDNEIGREGVCV